MYLDYSTAGCQASGIEQVREGQGYSKMFQSKSLNDGMNGQPLKSRPSLGLRLDLG